MKIKNMKNDKMKKNNFIRDQEGYKGETEEICFTTHFSQIAKQIFCCHLHFFYFRISNCFVIAKEELQKKITVESN